MIPNLKDYEETKRSFTFAKAAAEISFFADGTLNAGYIAVDVAAQKNGKKIALYWEGDNKEKKTFTFAEISLLSNKFANLLQSFGVKKGDRVFFFLPKVPQVYYGLLGALKAGAIAGTFFPAFGKQALYDRLNNSGAKVLVTNSELYERIKEIEKTLPELEKVLLIDKELEALTEKASSEFSPVHLQPDDPMFMLYTSATGNTPVCGIVTPQKAIIQQKITAKWVLDLHDEDVYWCTADPGWVTGAVYGILAPWSLGISQVVYAGRFEPEKWYEVIQNYKVSVLYTAPTAIRMLMADNEALKKYDLSSLRHLCSVGEALPPACVEWTMKYFGLPIHDTWWQTETGAMMITNYRSLKIKPGSMGKPIPGLQAGIINEKSEEVPEGTEGDLAFKTGWPSMMIDVWRNPERYKTYFRDGWFISGDRATKDKDGYYWFIGRTDDVIKTSGERVGPFEVEAALQSHPAVLESGVIGKPDPLRGQIIKAFIVLKPGVQASEELKIEIQKFVKKELAGHAYPREIEFIDKLPKNRSGKIVRRLLKAKELGLPLGDISTLED